MKKHIAFLMFVLGLTVSAAMAQSLTPPAQGKIVVAELFTSQNCPSCPPADRLFNEIVDQPGTIALACHITYFNTGRWQDPLSRDFCTARQGQYSRSLGLNGRVYTPQMIINGGHHFNGSDKSTVDQNLRTSKNVTAIPLSFDIDRNLSIALPALSTSSQSRIIVFGYKKHHFQPVSAGVNAGNAFYSNSAISSDELTTWNGTAQKITFRRSVSVPADGYIVFAQDTETGKIIAAGKIES